MDDDTPEEIEAGSHTFRSSMNIRATTLSTKERSALLDLAKSRALDPDSFDEEGNEPFFWTARASNQNVDSYYTRMDESSLNNYARDATDPGVQFQNSHNGGSIFGGEVGFGRSLQGKVTGRAGAKEVLIDFYAIPGLQCGNMTSDQFIRGTRTGIYADVSIGFLPGQMICNICGNDWLKRYEWLFGGDDEEETCRHWPGKEYEVGDGKSKKKVRCILDVMNGRLSEVSTVYDGATPGAGIAAVDMARMMSAEGKLSDVDRTFVENLYRVRIAPPPGMHSGVDIEYSTSTRGTTMTKKATEERTEAEAVEETAVVADVTSDDDDGGRISLGKKPEVATAESADPMERLRTKYAGTGIDIGKDPYRMIERLADHCLSQAQEIETLSLEAEYGRQAREAKLEELDGSVVRAFGAEGADKRQALHRKAVTSMSMDEVQSYIDDLEGRAKARIPGGQITRIDTKKGDNEDNTSVVDENHVPRGKTPARLVM